jgi:Predicted membrane protein
MRARLYGLVAAWAAYPFIAAAVALSPWFSIYDNALSDLGNYGRQGGVAFVFNAGLVVAGLFAAAAGVAIGRAVGSRWALPWAITISLAGVDLALVGVFSEDFGWIHSVVSVALFTLFGLSMLAYAATSVKLGSGWLGLYAACAAIASIIIWGLDWSWRGVAIQELVASLLVSVMLTLISIKHA